MAPPSSRILPPASRAPSLLGGGTSRNNQTVRRNPCVARGICYDTGFVNRGVSTHLGRTYPDMAWEPKAACTALADYCRG
jgi:hypothetical protein